MRNAMVVGLIAEARLNREKSSRYSSKGHTRLYCVKDEQTIVAQPTHEHVQIVNETHIVAEIQYILALPKSASEQWHLALTRLADTVVRLNRVAQSGFTAQTNHNAYCEPKEYAWLIASILRHFSSVV